MQLLRAEKELPSTQPGDQGLLLHIRQVSEIGLKIYKDILSI